MGKFVTKTGTNGEFYFNLQADNGQVVLTSYGAFSVNPSEVDVVIKYIANQKAHHSKNNFQEEYRVFLKKYEVDYDERFVWD